jgi:ATP adenylyltransferase
VPDAGVDFVVRRATDLARKHVTATPRDERDPFDPPETELFVADLSPTHFALLNKYNVLDRHLLAVTRAWADQEEILDPADFEAFAACMEGERVLGFYNGGREAGASQPHKHLQVVRLPLSPRSAIPIQELIDRSGLDALPYRCAFAHLGNEPDPGRRARMLHDRYRELLHAAGLHGVRQAGGERQSGPYNLLLAHDWMLIVPRTRESFEGIAVNSLAFAGALFVRGEDQARTLERVGPMGILRGVTRPRD